MDWTFIGRIADVAGILGFIVSIVSLIVSYLIFSSIKLKKNYNLERNELYSSLCALRESLWNDQCINNKTIDELQTLLYRYRMNYWKISSPVCQYHVLICIHLLSKNDFDKYNRSIQKHLNYIIARFSSKEETNG